MNKDILNFFTSWDVRHINIYMATYLWVPVIALLLYACFPRLITWSFVIMIITLGLSINGYSLIVFKHVSLYETASLITEFLLILALAITFLYLSGPYIQKKYKLNNEERFNNAIDPTGD